MDERALRDRLDSGERRLSPFAARATTSRGRRSPEPPDPLRTTYQVDRERILTTKAFRRLKHKTQVFIAPQLDHYVTRLTHTLEVANVARTIARALNLNEDLAEAAALGHDIGHGPFGHAGEEALAACLPDGFRHNYQSVRVLDVLESGPDGRRGLNLTFETLDAIEKSSKTRDDILAEGWGVPITLEGQAVKIADAVAYVNHDILDAIRAGIISEQDLPEAAQFGLGRSYRERVDAMITDIVEASWSASGESGPSPDPPVIQFSPRMRAIANELREFMFQRVYLWDSTRQDAERGIRVVRFLFDHFVRNPEGISPDFSLSEDPVERRAADYISGMTDRFAIRLARSLGCPDATWDIS